MFKIFPPRLLLAVSLLAATGLASPSRSAFLSQPAAPPQSVPSPESVLGFAVGDDFKLASYDESLEYFRALDSASDRLQLMEVGLTSEGQRWYVALISSEENLADLERYREISLRIAHPEGLTDDEARALAREGRAIVSIDGGLHSTETAHGQHTIQLAYDLITEKDGDMSRAILDNVILVLWFSINPDGQNMVVDWYRQNLGTPYEIAPMPRLYQKYIGHDNNRDGYGLNMLESRVAVRTERHFEPQVLYSHHMTAPGVATIWLPPYAEPISPFLHPLIHRTSGMMGMAAARLLDERGLYGATHLGSGYDAWYPGYIDFVNSFHNIVYMFSETGLHADYATPHFYRVQDFPPAAQDLRPEAMHTSLWRGGWWRLRDSVDYMLTTSTSVLDVTAKFRESILYDRYQAGRDTIRRYGEGPPYAYFVPQRQRDPVAAVEMLRRLAYQDIEIHQLREEVVFDGIAHPAGTWVIPMNRANANLAQALLSMQEYPDIRPAEGAPPDQPYDVAGWTLPYQMNVRVIAAGAPLTDEVMAAMEPVRGEAVSWDSEDDAAPFDSVPGPGFDTNPIAAGVVPPAGRVGGSGSVLSVDPAQNNAFRALNRGWRAGGSVRFAPGSPGEDGAAATSGRYLISGLDPGTVDEMVADLALQAERVSADGATGATQASLPQPRIGLYRPWRPSIDEGWTRWLLENYGFEFTNLRNADVLAGDLGDRYDVIILSDMGAGQILEGYRPGQVPGRYAGGIGTAGVRELDRFIRAGGTLVCLDSSSLFAIEAFHLPVENVVSELERDEFYLPGSIVEMMVDVSHPVMAGMPERAKVMTDNSPVFTVTEEFDGAALAYYRMVGSPLLSGYLLGSEHIQGYATALDARHGDGHILLIGFRPQWRAQPVGTFRVLFNAALYSSEVAATVIENPGFWEAPAEEEEGGQD